MIVSEGSTAFCFEHFVILYKENIPTLELVFFKKILVHCMPGKCVRKLGKVMYIS